MNVLILNGGNLTSPIKSVALRKKWQLYEVADFEDGIEFLRQVKFQMLFVRLNNKDQDRMEPLKKIRCLDSEVPVIAITSVDCGFERARAWEFGATFCLTEPLNKLEVDIAASTAVRLHARPNHSVVRLGEIKLDLDRSVFFAGDRQLNLSRKEFLLLESLALAKGRVVTRGQILNHLYPQGDYNDDKILDVLVCKVRSKIRKMENIGDIIQTSWGVGYRITCS